MASDSPTDERLRAVERALTGTDQSLDRLSDAAAVADDVADLEERIAALEDRVDELDAALQAVRGYVGNVRHVNREIERTAEAALAEARASERTDPLAAADLDGVFDDARGDSGGDGDHADENTDDGDDTGALARVRALL